MPKKKTIVAWFVAGMVCWLLPILTLAAVPYQKISITGENASHGVFDCSLEYTADGSTGYMAYSACDHWPEKIHTHLAKTTDHGRSWTYVQAINVSEAVSIDISGTMTPGTWHHEVPTLVHDPDDPGKEWKLYWHRYFSRAPHNPAADSMWAYGWIAYKTAGNPEAAWSAEIPLFGAGAFPPSPYSVQINLNSLHTELTAMLAYTEPAGLYGPGALYLALQGNTANPDEQILFLIKSADHGANWSFVDVLANSQNARDLGYDYLTAPSLVAEDNRHFLFASPGRSALPDHDGTMIIEFEDLATASLHTDGNQVLEVFKYLAPSLSTINAGESDYDAHNTNGGIVMPQLQQTPSVEFQLWNTFEPLVPTPTVEPTVTMTPDEGELDITAFPNPGWERIRFLVKGGKSMGQAIAIEIYNMSGERIARITRLPDSDPTPVIIWECPSVASGIYIARVSIGGQEKKNIKIGIIRK